MSDKEFELMMNELNQDIEFQYEKYRQEKEWIETMEKLADIPETYPIFPDEF